MKMKNCKTFYETQTASRLKEIIQSPSTPHTNLATSLKQNFLREICRNIQTFAFKVLQESSSWASGNGAVQILFFTPNRNMVAGKFVNWESFWTMFWDHVIFNFKRAEIRKMSEVFCAKLYGKMCDLFGWFLLALSFFATNSGIKKNWWCPLERVD